MSSKWPKYIHDSVHRLIRFDDSPCDHLLLDLINAREFQRLRRIKQLGVTELTFPGANHSRFAHSVGVVQVARLFLARIALVTGSTLKDFQSAVVLAAALLHDVGHGPFSHVFEKISDEHHESRTREIVLDESTEVNQILRSFDSSLPESVAAFWEKDLEDSSDNHADVPAFLTQIVSSQLDADRFDYLIRDSYSAGVEYGTFDFNWLINHLYLNEDKGRFYLSSKALLAAEAYVFARYHMYKIVYYHKTTRSAEMLLRLAFKRYKSLLEGVTFDAAKNIAPDAPLVIVKAFRGKMSMGEYLSLDDHVVSGFLVAASGSEDNILRDLAGRILNRRLYKARDVGSATPDSVANFRERALEFCRSKGLDRDYCFACDTPGDTPYKYYDPDRDQENSQIYVENWEGKQVEISTLSDPVASLKKKYLFTRYYYPDCIRDDINSIAKETLRD